MFLAFLTVLFIAGSAFGSPLANQYVDSVLNTALRNQIRMLNLDPATLPDFVTEFQDKVAIIGKVKGRSEFSNGNIAGLSFARRSSECQGPYYSFGAKAINCTITFDNLQINYDGKLKYGHAPKVNIKGKATVSNTNIFIEVTNQQPSMPNTLNNFLFRQIGFFDVKFTGLGPLNKFTKFLEDGFKAHAEAEIFNLMSQRLKYALSKAVTSVPLPN